MSRPRRFSTGTPSAGLRRTSAGGIADELEAQKQRSEMLLTQITQQAEQLTSLADTVRARERQLQRRDEEVSGLRAELGSLEQEVATARQQRDEAARGRRSVQMQSEEKDRVIRRLEHVVALKELNFTFRPLNFRQLHDAGLRPAPAQLRGSDDGDESGSAVGAVGAVGIVGDGDNAEGGRARSVCGAGAADKDGAVSEEGGGGGGGGTSTDTCGTGGTEHGADASSGTQDYSGDDGETKEGSSARYGRADSGIGELADELTVRCVRAPPLHGEEGGGGEKGGDGNGGDGGDGSSGGGGMRPGQASAALWEKRARVVARPVSEPISVRDREGRSSSLREALGYTTPSKSSTSSSSSSATPAPSTPNLQLKKTPSSATRADVFKEINAAFEFYEDRYVCVCVCVCVI